MRGTEHLRELRRVVLVAYFFPPTGGVSVARMLRPAEYLRRYGWRPVVVAPASTGFIPQDPSGLAAIPADLEVLRTSCPEPAKLRALLRTRFRAAPPAFIAPGGTGRAPAQRGGWRRAIANTLSAALRATSFPDEQIGWLPFAFVAAIRASREGRADAILSTSSPATAHLVAMLASKVSSVPWVADFRDPWVTEYLRDGGPRLVGGLRRRLERQFIARAAQATFATPSMTRLYQARYPEFADRMHTIPNGYDHHEEVASVPRDHDHFTIVWAGSMAWPHELEVFLAGVRSAVSDSLDLQQRLRVRFVGHSIEECSRILREAALSPELGPMLQVVGPVPRAVALGHMAACDAALLMLPSGPGAELNVSGKLYDYIGRDIQVLAVIPQCDAGDVLRHLGWGVIATPTVEDVADRVRELVASRPSRSVADPAREYDWVNLTGLFAAALDRASDGSERIDQTGLSA